MYCGRSVSRTDAISVVPSRRLAFFYDHKRIYLILELASGGELYKSLVDVGRFRWKNRSRRNEKTEVGVAARATRATYVHRLNVST